MKVDETYRLGWYLIHIKAGAPKVVDGALIVELCCHKRIIRWRWLLWKMTLMFCNTLDICLYEPKMILLRKNEVNDG